MLSKIEINNFKSILKADIIFKPLTILTGINSSGKSSVIQLINIASSVISNKQTYGHGTCDDLRCRYAAKGEHINASAVLGASGRYETIKLSVEDNNFKQTNTLNNQYRLCMVSANRLGQQMSFYTPKGYLATSVGDQGEFVVPYCISNQHKLLRDDKRQHVEAEAETFEYSLEAWMREICPNVRFRFDIEGKIDAGFYTLGDTRDNTIQERPTNVGFGISYTLPVVAQLLGAIPGDIVCIENPEAHLHPLGQTKLGELVSRTAGSGVQVIIETHSDHFIDGMRIAVKEGILAHNKVSVVFFSKNSSNITEYVHLEVTEDGDMTDWPAGFFDQSVKNLAKLARF